MPIPVTPEIIPLPFAQNGQKNTIPEQGGATTDPAASWSAGFPPITMINKQAGGKPPYGMDFNGIFNALSQHIFFSQSGCVYPWMGADEETEFAGLNYLKGSHVLGSDGEEYVALQPSGPDVPATGGGYVGPKNPTGSDGTIYWKTINSGETTSEGVPIGSIVAFSGTFGGTDGRRPIPPNETEPLENWVICDGTATNGIPVPDLRGRMILGASETHQAGDTGGSETHSHSLSGTVGATTLSVEQIANHKHIWLPGMTDHTSVGQGAPGVGVPNGTSGDMTAVGGSQPHTHSLSGASGQASSMPPYYALSFIMRCA